MKVAAHLSEEAVHQRMKRSATMKERLHWQVISLAQQGRRGEEIAQTVGYSGEWVRHLVRLYSAQGPDALLPRRKGNKGCTALLHDAVRAELHEALCQPVPEALGGGLWNGVKVAAWLSARLARPVYRQRGQEALRALGYSCQSPRPRHAGADPQEQKAFKKSWQRA